MTELGSWMGLLQSSTGYDEAQELSGWYVEYAFLRVKLNVVCSEVIEREPQVVY